MNPIKITIAGRSAAQCEIIRQLLDNQPDLSLSVLTLEPGHLDPFRALSFMPDILVASLDTEGEDVLRAIGAHRGRKPALIAIGPAGDAAMMRQAMQAGARDYFAVPIHVEDLLQSVRSIRADIQPTAPGASANRTRLVAVINAKGGSGASTIAANLAHIGSRTPSQREVALVDLDVQFGALPLMFDLRTPGSLLGALESPDTVNRESVAGFASRHRSGVGVFSAMSEQFPLPWELSAHALSHLLAVIRESYAFAVVDLPRQIDPLTSVVLTEADQVIVVMQQSLVHARDAKRMLRILTSTLAVPRENITLVINRFKSGGGLSEKEIEEAVSPPRMTTLPNDYNAVVDAQNIGVPLLELKRHSLISDALETMYKDIVHGRGSAEAPAKPSGLKAALKRAFGG